MSNIADVQTAYLVEVNKITDPIALAEAKCLLDNLISAMTAEASLSGQNITSYSAAQVSVTRRQIKDLQVSIDKYRGQLRRMLQGNMEYPDMRGDYAR